MVYLVSMRLIKVRRVCALLAVLAMMLLPLLASAEAVNKTTGSESESSGKISVGLNKTVNSTAKESGLKSIGSLGQLTGNAIGMVLGLVGVLFFVLMVYAGVLWMTARGNDEQISKAKNIFSGAVIGIFIVIASYYILDFVFDALYSSFQPEVAAPETETK